MTLYKKSRSSLKNNRKGKSQGAISSFVPPPPFVDSTTVFNSINKPIIKPDNHLVSSLRKIICTGNPGVGLPNIRTSCATNAAVQFMFAFPEVQALIISDQSTKKTQSKLVKDLYDVLILMIQLEKNPSENTDRQLRDALVSLRNSSKENSLTEGGEIDGWGDSFELTKMFISDLGLGTVFAFIRVKFDDKICRHGCILETSEKYDSIPLYPDHENKQTISSLIKGTNFTNFEEEFVTKCPESGELIRTENPCKGQKLNHIYVKLSRGQKSICWSVMRTTEPGYETPVFRPELEAEVYVLTDNYNKFASKNENGLIAKCVLRKLELRALTFSTGNHFYAARRNSRSNDENDWVIYDDDTKHDIKYEQLMDNRRQRQVLMILYVLVDVSP